MNISNAIINAYQSIFESDNQKYMTPDMVTKNVQKRNNQYSFSVEAEFGSKYTHADANRYSNYKFKGRYTAEPDVSVHAYTPGDSKDAFDTGEMDAHNYEVKFKGRASWKNRHEVMKDFLKYVKGLDPEINETCGFHVHIGIGGGVEYSPVDLFRLAINYKNRSKYFNDLAGRTPDEDYTKDSDIWLGDLKSEISSISGVSDNYSIDELMDDVYTINTPEFKEKLYAFVKAENFALKLRDEMVMYYNRKSEDLFQDFVKMRNAGEAKGIYVIESFIEVPSMLVREVYGPAPKSIMRFVEAYAKYQPALAKKMLAMHALAKCENPAKVIQALKDLFGDKYEEKLNSFTSKASVKEKKFDFGSKEKLHKSELEKRTFTINFTNLGIQMIDKRKFNTIEFRQGAGVLVESYERTMQWLNAIGELLDESMTGVPEEIIDVNGLNYIISEYGSARNGDYRLAVKTVDGKLLGIVQITNLQRIGIDRNAKVELVENYEQ